MLTTKTLKRWEKVFESPFFNELTPMINLSFNGEKTEINETETTYEYRFIVPGFKKEELSISVVENLLSVKGETKTKGGERKFAKSILMVNEPTKSPTASLENGILTISVDKENIKKEKFNVIIK